MNPAYQTSLLPDALKQRSNKVRVLKPKVVLIDFHGTISERRWEEKIIFPYVKSAIVNFIKANIHLSDELQRMIPSLRAESFTQHFSYKNEDSPVIDDFVEGQENLDSMVEQVAEFALWQINNRRETNETRRIQQLVWMDGFKRKLIVTPIFADVFDCCKRWREDLKLDLYVASSLPSSTIELLLRNTSSGDLYQFMCGCLSPSVIKNDNLTTATLESKLMTTTYESFLKRILISLKMDDSHFRSLSSPKSNDPKCKSNSKDNNFPPQPPVASGSKSNMSLNQNSKSNSNNDEHKKQESNSNTSTHSNIVSPSALPVDMTMRLVLFLTDSGQEAKVAESVKKGKAYECLLVSRPGNRRLRTYYLSLFSYIKSFEDIEFVQR